MKSLRRVRKSNVNNYGALSLRRETVGRSKVLPIPSLIEYRIPPMEFQHKLDQLIKSNTQDALIYFDTNTNKFTFESLGKDCIPLYSNYFETEQECGTRFPTRARIKSMSELQAVKEYMSGIGCTIQYDQKALGNDKWISVDGKVCMLTSFKDDEHILTCNHLAVVRDIAELIN